MIMVVHSIEHPCMSVCGSIVHSSLCSNSILIIGYGSRIVHIFFIISTPSNLVVTNDRRPSPTVIDRRQLPTMGDSGTAAAAIVSDRGRLLTINDSR